jgi:dihydrolipoamide dehydrogenase
MANASYDVLVIGSGPGGYVAAIRAAQLGFKTGIVERYPKLGGTCLNVGCIPSKALLDSSEHWHNMDKHFAEHGILVSKPKLDFGQMIARKTKVVDGITGGVAFLMKKNKITVHEGHGSFTGPNTVSVAKPDGSTELLEAKHLIIATGSKPNTLPGVTIDKQRIITSTEALALPEQPKKMLVIGAGIIGLELASVYARIGTEVQVVEYADRCIPTMDKDLGKEIEKVLKKELGVQFFFSHKVKGTSVKGKTVTLTADNKDGQEVTFTGDYCLVAVGRRPYTDNLGLDKAGLATTERGFLPVNERLQTSVPHIWAVGDVVGGQMLAHKASEEGIAVAERIAGQQPHIHYHHIPGVVYTWPEVAAVGYTEDQLKEKGIAYKVGKFPFMAIGRAKASGDDQGFVKILADKTTDEVLGVHMIGARTADLIAEAVVAMGFRASAEDLAILSHAHPTYAEAVKEAALAATGNRALHM